MWSLGTVDEWLQDLRFAMRAVRATPAFSLVVTVTFALGIAATTAMYSLVDSVLARPLPYAHAEQLVQLTDVGPTGRETPASYPEYIDWRDRTHAIFSDVSVGFGSGEVLQTAGGAEQLQGARVAANLPRMLGVRTIAGRAFRADEEPVSAPRVVMLGEGLWRSRFAGDASIIGRAITLTGQPYVVVGVFAQDPATLIPAAWQWSHRRLPDFLIPLRLDEKSSPRGLHWLSVVARLRAGIALPQARSRLTAIAQALQRDRATQHTVHALPLADVIVGGYRAPLLLLLAAVGLLLLIACANIANLMLSRVSARGREFAVRIALGAGRARLLRLVLAESIVRASIGGVCGIAAAYGLVAAIRGWLGGSVARVADASIDGRVLLASLLISLGCGVMLGILPALHAGRGDLVDDLRAGGRGMMGGGSRDRAKRVLVIAEVALSFMLVATAGLLTRSVVNLLQVPKGFDASNVVAGYTWLPSPRYRDSVSQKRFFDRFESDLAAVYGASNVTLASDLPIAGGTDGGVGVEGREYPDGNEPNAEKRIVGNNYFDMLHARLVAGRFFNSTDQLGAPAVVVINETFAMQLFPNASAIGKRVRFDWGIDGAQTIVGVVADLREGPLNRPSRPAIYISCEQRPNSSMRFLVRTNAPANEAAATFRRVLRGVDPTIPLVQTETMNDVVRTDTESQRYSMTMLGAFALLAIVLAAVGLYGVMSYSVAQRTQELGIRAALGALPRDLMILVLRQGVRLTMSGLAFGVAGAAAARKLTAAQLFGVGPTDLATFTAAGTLLAVVAILATLVPTRRAASADPARALRAE